MKYSILFALTFVIASCKDARKSEMEPLDWNMVTEQIQANKPHPGKLLMEQECYSCHDPKVLIADRTAPLMGAIKRHYIDTNTTKEEFTEAFIR